MKGKLFVVATPIGNLDDMSFRAVETLRSVNKILAEDTRVISKLLNNFDIKNTIESFHAHSASNKYDSILKDLVEGMDLALVTDAGTPGISDPGNELIDYLLMRDDSIQIIPVPGASSLTTAASVCGFNMNKFIFLGFLPKKKLNKTLEFIANSDVPVICFDSPHRIIKNIQKLSELVKEGRRVFVGRELTKMFETHYRGEIKQVLAQLKSEKNLKGELVLIVDKD